MNDNWVGGHVWEHIPAAIPRGKKANRRKLSTYRYGKAAAHVTRGGVGIVGQLMGHTTKAKGGTRPCHAPSGASEATPLGRHSPLGIAAKVKRAVDPSRKRKRYRGW